jgi:hypothetical protein
MNHPARNQGVITRYAVLTTTIALCPAFLSAQPSISDVQGTVATGQSITISGSGFGAKAAAAPLLWADFAEGNTDPSPLGRITSWDIAEAPVLDTNPSADCHSASCMTSGSCFWELGPGCSNTTPGEGNGMAIGINPGSLAGTYGQQMYINFWRKIGGTYASVIQSSTGPNVKWLRLWGDNATLGGEAPHAYPDTYTNEVACNGGLPMFTEYGGWEVWAGTWLIPTTTWRNEEYIYQYNSANAEADGTFDVQINQMLKSSSTNWQSDSTKSPMTGQGDIDIQDEFSPNICPSGVGNSYMPQSGDQIWYDSIYIDSTWQRVMICDASTWASRMHCEIQVPSAWSDNGSDNGTAASATVTVHEGSFTSGTQAYLYVVGSTNVPNTKGFPVTLGGSGGSGDVPAQVTVLTATPSTGQVALSWTAASGATSYNVERSLSSSGPFVSIATPSGTSYTDTNVTAGTTYYYEVAGVNSVGTGPVSSIISATVPAQVKNATFTLSLNPTSATLNSGQSLSITVNVTPQNGFNQQVNLTCSGLPLAATCSFSPPTVTPSGSAAKTTLTVATNVARNPVHAPSAFGSPLIGHSPMGGDTLLAFILLGFGRLFRSRRRWKRFFCAFAVLAALGLAICGCTAKIGGGENGGTTTPAGTSTITVTAAAGSLSQSGIFTLTVQ